MSRPVHSLYDQAQERTATAVIYLRVSTKEQAETGGETEGYSIPAQREACLRKAEALGAQVVAEFVERGESATTANRPELQRMLALLDEQPVGYVIVHKVDRLARSRADDALITLRLHEARIGLVSCTESIDETPSGRLLHGIMASIAEFYSRNLASEVVKGAIQKAKSGGTPGKAPIGYLNVRDTIEGREARTVKVDPERAPLMQWAFEQFASGDWTIRTMGAELERRGLKTPAGPRTPSKPLSHNQLHRCLRNPYYKGVVRYSGVAYPGKHKPLVSEKLWDQVQAVLDANNHAGVHSTKHDHYLKGSVFCGQCSSRLILSHTKNRHGTIYPYFVCIGRQQKRTECRQKALLIEDVEHAIEQYYENIRLSEAEAEAVREWLSNQLRSAREQDEKEQRRQKLRLGQLERQQRKLLESYYAEAIPLDLFRSEMERITKEIDGLKHALEDAALDAALVETNLTRATRLLPRIQQAYLEASPKVRRQYNQAFFSKLKLSEDLCVAGELTGVWQAIYRPQLAGEPQPEFEACFDGNENDRPTLGAGLRRALGSIFVGQGLNFDYLVGEGGLEPPHPFGHRNLNPARLPIPPLARVVGLVLGDEASGGEV